MHIRSHGVGGQVRLSQAWLRGSGSGLAGFETQGSKAPNAGLYWNIGKESGNYSRISGLGFKVYPGGPRPKSYGFRAQIHLML